MMHGGQSLVRRPAGLEYFNHFSGQTQRNVLLAVRFSFSFDFFLYAQWSCMALHAFFMFL